MRELGKGNVIADKSFELALGVVDFCEILNQNRRTAIANQLIRSGTAPGALVAESQNAESKADFIHKMKIALKEANETCYWLTLCEKSTHLPTNNELKALCEDVIKILSKIVSSTKVSG